MTEHDVVVVGAGLAGLRAAAVLARHGLDVAVLDAADRPGGRIATDVVDGFRLDRGFQVLNTIYPALRAAVDLDPLHLCPFVPGAAIRTGDGALHTFGNPLRRPALAWPTITDGLFGPLAKARLVAWTAQVVATPPQRTATRIDRSAARDFAAARLDGPVVDQFLRPFLSGVLGERELVTSAAYVRLVWRCFALGTIAVPADGMGAAARPPRRRPAGQGLVDGAAGHPGRARPRRGRRGDAARAGGRRRRPTRAPRLSCSPAWKSRSCARSPPTTTRPPPRPPTRRCCTSTAPAGRSRTPS